MGEIMGYITRNRLEPNSADLEGFRADLPVIVTKIEIDWCVTRQASVVRLFKDDKEITYFMCTAPTTVEHIQNTLNSVVFGKMTLNSSSIYIGQTRFYSGFLSPVEALVRAINSEIR